MSYAIIRNDKLTRVDAQGSYIHNDRRSKGHSNKDIDPTRTHLNFWCKKNELTYIKEFDKMKKEYDLKGTIRSNSNIMCEMMITSDNAFFNKIGLEETKRYFKESYKFVCNFENTKKVLDNIKLELPQTPNINDIKLIKLNREKVENEIIKPKDDKIMKLYQENLKLHNELSKQVNLVNKAEKYQKERDSILADNRELHNQVNNMKAEYKEKEFDIEWKYKNKIKSLEKENTHLHKIIDKFYETVDKFIVWICHKFGIGESKELVRNFEKETRTFIDPVKQLNHEKREKEWDLEL
ncbi:mobilization protein [Clostridium sp. CAG:575]|nr:mobilization protein [Clostridium sp. CAG:575]